MEGEGLLAAPEFGETQALGTPLLPDIFFWGGVGGKTNPETNKLYGSRDIFSCSLPPSLLLPSSSPSFLPSFSSFFPKEHLESDLLGAALNRC